MIRIIIHSTFSCLINLYLLYTIPFIILIFFKLVHMPPQSIFVIQIRFYKKFLLCSLFNKNIFLHIIIRTHFSKLSLYLKILLLLLNLGNALINHGLGYLLNRLTSQSIRRQLILQRVDLLLLHCETAELHPSDTVRVAMNSYMGHLWLI